MCTLETRGNIFLLTLTGNNEHRFSPTLISEIRTLLAQIRSQSKPGSILITTGEGKFFSNGLDLAWAKSNGQSNFLDRLHQLVIDFKPLIADLISLPLPTIAAVNGHAAAAGFLLALGHDSIFMRKDKGVLYMSEIDIGLPLPDYFRDLLMAKLGSPRNMRDVALHGVKVKGEEAVERGIVDGAYDSAEETFEAALRVGGKLGARNWNGEVYSEIRKSSLKPVLPVLGLVDKGVLAAKL